MNPRPACRRPSCVRSRSLSRCPSSSARSSSAPPPRRPIAPRPPPSPSRGARRGTARPRDPFADQKGSVWFVGQAGNYVGRLDPKTRRVQALRDRGGDAPAQPRRRREGDGLVHRQRERPHRAARSRDGQAHELHDARSERARSAHDDLRSRTATRGSPRRTPASSASSRPPTARSASGRWRRDSRPYGIVLDSKGPSLVRSLRHEQDRHDRSEDGRVPRVHAAERSRAAAPHRDHERRRRSGTATTRAATSAGSIRRAGKVDEWALPSGGMSLPYAMTIDDRGRIWLAETGTAAEPARRVRSGAEEVHRDDHHPVATRRTRSGT